MSAGIGSSVSGGMVANLLAGQIDLRSLMTLVARLQQDWFDFCSEITDFPRCGQVPDDLRRMHMARIEAAECVLSECLEGGDATAALTRLGRLF